MTWQHTPYTLPLAAATAMAFVVAIYVWQRRTNSGAIYLFAVMSGATWWGLCYTLHMASAEVAAKEILQRATYLGVLVVPTMWLAFALDYTGHGDWFRRRALWFVPVPLATFALLVTNAKHGLFWSASRTYAYRGFLVYEVDPWLGFWAHALYSYALLLSGTALLLYGLVRAPTTYRGQYAAVLLGCLAPWAANGLTIFDVVPWRHLDLTPFAFSLSGLSLGLGLYRFRLLDLVPMAKDMVVERMQDGLILLDEWGRIADLNPRGRALFGDGEEVIGRLAMELVPAISALMVDADSKEHAEAVLDIAVDGNRRHFHAQRCAMGRGAGPKVGHLVVLHDITARLRTEDRLRELKDAAEAASRAKSSFLAHMNHELRNPLTAIMGNAERLQLERTGELNERQQKAVAAILKGSEILLEMINESLDMARIEEGRVELHATTFLVDELVDEIADGARDLVEKRGNQLQVSHAGDAAEMHSDRVKIRQCVLNLLTNAAKFTEAGQVQLRAQRRERFGATWIDLSVADTGIGIDADKLETIFEPFSQASAETANRYGGTGLGLPIARNFARILGGELVVDSRPGEGSTFTVRLPTQMPIRG